MAISQTTFEERLNRINKGQAARKGRTAPKGRTLDASAINLRPKKTSRPFSARCLTFPCAVGIGILTGGTAYAFAATRPEMQWVMAFAG